MQAPGGAADRVKMGTGMERAVDPDVLTFVAAAFRDQMKHAGITIDDLASAFIDIDTAELERRLGRRVLPAELLRRRHVAAE
jgi:hypothetical protein